MSSADLAIGQGGEDADMTNLSIDEALDREEILPSFDEFQAEMFLGDSSHRCFSYRAIEGLDLSNADLLLVESSSDQPFSVVFGGGTADGAIGYMGSGHDVMDSLDFVDEAHKGGGKGGGMQGQVFEGGSSGTCSASSSSPRSDRGGVAVTHGSVINEDKKRRNRDAARTCRCDHRQLFRLLTRNKTPDPHSDRRAKKKQSIQALQINHEELAAKYDGVKRENESLKSVNSALEKQVAYFQALFKDSWHGAKPILPVSFGDEAEREDKSYQGIGATKTASASCALGMAFLVATYNLRISQDASLPPGLSPLRSGRPGRALLSVQDEVTSYYGSPEHHKLVLSLGWPIIIVLTGVLFALLMGKSPATSHGQPKVSKRAWGHWLGRGLISPMASMLLPM